MTTWCSHCGQWSALPAHAGQGEAVRVLCEHCQAPLDAASRYRVCADCGRYHRIDYEVCPFGVEEGLVPRRADTANNGEYTTEAQKRRPKKRDGEYYWQLYIDYQDRAAAPPPVPPIEEPPHPGESGELEPGMASEPAGGGPTGNGNGYAASPHANGQVGVNGANGRNDGSMYTPAPNGSHVE